MATTPAVDLATSVVEAARGLGAVEWRKLSDAELLQVAAAITRAGALLDGALLRAVERIEALDATAAAGWASTKDFLTDLTGGPKGTGGGLVRAAEQLRSLPGVQAALDQGAITLPQARAIAGAIHPLPRDDRFRGQVAAKLLDLALTQRSDASALRTAVEQVVREVDPQAKIIDAEAGKQRAEKGAHQARHLSFNPDRWGGVRLTGYGTVEDVELIKTTLMPLAAPQVTAPGACGGVNRPEGAPWRDANGESTTVPCPQPGCGHDGRDVREHGARMWDALVETCGRLASTGTLPRDHGNRPTLIITIDQESLRQQAIAAGLAHPGETSNGALLSALTLRRLACDADIIPMVLGSRSQPLDVGRAQRLVTRAIWHALIARDQHCAFPGCTRPPIACEAHHITHWADGGPTALTNLVLLCRRHHTLTHRSAWTITINPHTGHPVWQRPTTPDHPIPNGPPFPTRHRQPHAA